MTSRRGLVLCVVVGLLAAGCGARWTDGQQEQVAARYAGGGSGSSSGGGTTTGSGAAAGSTGSAATSGAGAAAGGQAAGGAGGAAAPDGGAADPGAQGTASASLPCAAPSDAPGVTDTEIAIGTINSLTGPVPGLGATSEAAVRSYVAYRNAVGGVCGRQLTLLAADDGTDSGRFRSAILDLAPRVLGFAGIFANGDGGGASVVEAEQIPVVGAASTTVFQDVSTVFDTNPPPADLGAVIAKYRFLVEQGVRTAAVATLSNDAAVAELDVHQAQMEAAGIQVVSRQILPVTTLSFDSAARAVANSGAQYLFFLGAENHDAAMARAMRDSGYTLLFEEYLTGYGSVYTDLAGPAAEGTTSWIRSLPNEDGGANPEQAAFLEWMGATAPEAATDVYAAAAWAGTKAFVDSIEALPGPITREAFIAQLRATTTFDAGGFFGPIDLGNERSNGCLVGMRFEGGQWRRMAPASGFLC